MPAFGLGFGLPFKKGLGFNPALLNPLQWLYKQVDVESIDKTANALDADYVDNNCVTLDGLADHMTVTGISVTDYPATLSASVLIDPAHGTGAETPIFLGDSGSSANYLAVVVNNNRAYLRARDGVVDDFVSSGIVINDGAVHTLEARFISTTERELWVDGAPAVTSTTSVSFPSSVDTLAVGRNGDSSPDGYFDGNIVEASVASSELTAHYTFAGGVGVGVTEYDTSGNGNNGTWTTGAGGVATLRSGTQDVVAHNIENGFSKILTESGTTEIAVSGLAGTETITKVGTATVTPSAGKLTISSGYVSTISIDGVLTYEIENAYGTTIKSSNGTWGDGVLTGGAYGYIPALDSGTNDVLGLGLSNPPCGTDGVHNNAESKIQQKATSTALLTNPFWSAGGVTFDKKSFEDLITHLSFDNNVVVNATSSSFIKEILTWPISYEWTVSNFTKMVDNWLKDSVSPILYPLTDSEAEYITDANGYLIFPAGS